MAELPKDLDSAIAQAKEATRLALDAGYTRLQVEIMIPELKVMPVAASFLPMLEGLDLNLRVFFPDAGAAALARRDWGEKPYDVRGIGELKAAIQPEDQLFLFIEPSSVEVKDVEKLCEQAGDRPVILLNPRLEDIATIGIGYAGRQLRERFLNAIESCYHLRPLDGGAILRAYPDPWQVWLETDPDQYKVIAELPRKPVGEELERIFIAATTPAEGDPNAAQPTKQPIKKGFLADLQNMFRALTQ